MNSAEAMKLAYQTLAQYGLHDWTVRFSRSKNTLGHCNYALREIALSKHWIPLTNDGEMWDVILHEVAHAKVGPNHNHDNVWRRQFLDMGGSGDARKATVKKVESKYYGTCANHPMKATRHALSHNMTSNNWFCKRCRNEGRPDNEAALVWYLSETGKPIKQSIVRYESASV